MLEGRYQRGFSQERLAGDNDPRVRKDEKGYYTMSLSENAKVYFDDFYRFLELTYENGVKERDVVLTKQSGTPETHEETLAFYRAKSVIIDLLLKTIRRFYCDGGNFGVVMTPWCFGTVMLEKIEVYRERLTKGEISDPNIPDYPYYVVRYLEEIYKTTLLELFDFPENAFHMRWQYSELLKRYSKILTNITDSLNSVLKSVKNYGS
jgi:hypothetical protein